MINRKPFTPVVGKTYHNQGGGEFTCLSIYEDQESHAIMQSTKSGWQLAAHGIGIYEDGSIDWDYSTGGRFVKGGVQKPTH